MLVRKENEIEIWTDEPQKGQAKYCFIASAIVEVVLSLVFSVFDSDYTIKETYYVLMFFVGLPTLMFVIAGFLNLMNERIKAQLIVKVNGEYIEIYEKKGIKKILLKQINKVIMQYYTFKKGDTIAIFYEEDSVEKKYFLRVPMVCRDLVKVAMKEYKSDLLIDEKRYHPLIKNKE